MDYMDFNLIHHLVSVEKYTYARVSDYLKTEYPNSRGFSERTIRRYCKENEISSRTDTNEVNRMVADAVSQVELGLSVMNLCLSAFVQYFISAVFCCLAGFWLHVKMQRFLVQFTKKAISDIETVWHKLLIFHKQRVYWSNHCFYSVEVFQDF